MSLLLEQIEIAMHKGLEGAAEAALHPPGAARHSPHLAVLQRKEGDDAVGVTPFAALENNRRGLAEAHELF